MHPSTETLYFIRELIWSKEFGMSYIFWDSLYILLWLQLSSLSTACLKTACVIRKIFKRFNKCWIAELTTIETCKEKLLHIKLFINPFFSPRTGYIWFCLERKWLTFVDLRKIEIFVYVCHLFTPAGYTGNICKHAF